MKIMNDTLLTDAMDFVFNTKTANIDDIQAMDSHIVMLKHPLENHNLNVNFTITGYMEYEKNQIIKSYIECYKEQLKEFRRVRNNIKRRKSEKEYNNSK